MLPVVITVAVGYLLVILLFMDQQSTPQRSYGQATVVSSVVKTMKFTTQHFDRYSLRSSGCSSDLFEDTSTKRLSCPVWLTLAELNVMKEAIPVSQPVLWSLIV